MRVVWERVEDDFERFAVTRLVGQVLGQREARPPVLRVLRDQPLAELGESSL